MLQEAEQSPEAQQGAEQTRPTGSLVAWLRLAWPFFFFFFFCWHHCFLASELREKGARSMFERY